MVKKGVFLTLTYDEENRPPDGGLRKRDLQLFFKRLRKAIAGKIKYFACGEYGERTYRPHYHAIMIGLGYGEAVESVGDCWRLGQVDVGLAEQDSINYVAQYVDKKYLSDDWLPEALRGLQRPFQVQSKGIGLEYAMANAWRLMEQAGDYYRGAKTAIPRYYVKKLEEVYPNEMAGVRDRIVSENVIRSCDEILEVCPEFGGKNYNELTEHQRAIFMSYKFDAANQVHAQLKKQGQINKLRKEKERI